MTELARVAGPLAAAGLALLILGRRRDLRLAGLGAWALAVLLAAATGVPQNSQNAAPSFN